MIPNLIIVTEFTTAFNIVFGLHNFAHLLTRFIVVCADLWYIQYNI